MKFAVTEITESRDTTVLDAKNEAEAFEAYREYGAPVFAKHTVTQQRYEVRPVEVVNDAQVIDEEQTIDLVQ